MALTRIKANGISDGTVVAADIANRSVTGTKIANFTIEANNISNTSITGDQIASGITLTTPTLSSPTLSGTAQGITAANTTSNSMVATTQFVNNQIAASPTINTPTINTATINTATINYGIIEDSTFASSFERANVRAEAAANTTFRVLDQSVLFYTSNSTANISVNFTGNATTTLDSLLNNSSNTVTAIVLMTNGATGYYINNVMIDGTVIHNGSVKGNLFWLGNTLTTGGNSVGIDSYGFTIIKKSANTYTVLASQSQYKSFLS